MKTPKTTAVLALAALVGLGHLVAADTPSPEPGEMLQFALTTLYTNLIGEIHQSKVSHDIRDEREYAREYYRALFAVWFGTLYRPTGEKVHFDPGGYVSAFLRALNREKFGDLIDYDDPIGWNRLPPNSDKQGLIDAMGGMDYYTRILEQTKNPDAYKAAVRQFRAFVETVKNDPEYR